MAIYCVTIHNTILITVSILWWRILTDYQDMSHITTRYSLNLDNSLSTTPQLDTKQYHIILRLILLYVTILNIITIWYIIIPFAFRVNHVDACFYEPLLALSGLLLNHFGCITTLILTMWNHRLYCYNVFLLIILDASPYYWLECA